MYDTAQLTRYTAHHGTAGDQEDSKRCNKQDVGPGAHGRFCGQALALAFAELVGLTPGGFFKVTESLSRTSQVKLTAWPWLGLAGGRRKAAGGRQAPPHAQQEEKSSKLS